jgi:hypothetical protein
MRSIYCMMDKLAAPIHVQMLKETRNKAGTYKCRFEIELHQVAPAIRNLPSERNQIPWYGRWRL